MPSLLDASKPLDGLPVRKGDLRDAFATVKRELEHGGFIRQAGAGAVERTVLDRLGDWFVGADYGAAGDDTATGALRAHTGKRHGQRALCSGRDALGDGGGGLFVWNASGTRPDDGALVIKPAAVDPGAPGRWERLFGDSVSVLWFGAKGDGITDDAPAITAALKSGHTVHFPSPRVHYRIKTTIRPQTIFTAVFHNNATIRAFGRGSGGEDPSDFDMLLDSKGVPTGLRVAFDLGGCDSSTFLGQFNFRWRNGDRPTRPPGIVAFSANFGSGVNSQIAWDILELRGWQAGFFQPPRNQDRSVPGDEFQPMFTRTTIRLFQAVNNWRAWETYANADDIVIINWRQKDSVMPSHLGSTALCVGYLFLSGCTGQSTRIPAQLNPTAVTGQNTIRMGRPASGANGHGLVPGDHVAVARRGTFDRRQLVRVAAVGETADDSVLTTDEPIDLDAATSAALVQRADAAGFLLDSSQLVAQACYIEDNFGDPLGQGVCFELVGSLPLISFGMLKISRGEFACKAGYPIHLNSMDGAVIIDSMGVDNGIVRTGAAFNRFVDGYVYVPALRRSTGERASRNVEVRLGWRKAFFEAARVEPVRYGDVPGAPLATIHGHAMCARLARASGDAVTAFRRLERVLQATTGAYGIVQAVDAANDRLEILNRSVTPFASGAANPVRGVDSGASMVPGGVSIGGINFTGVSVTNTALDAPWACDDLIEVRYGDGAELGGVARRIVPEAALRDAASAYNGPGFKAVGREAIVAETGDRVRAAGAAATNAWLYGKNRSAYRPGSPLTGLWAASGAVPDAFHLARHERASGSVDVAGLPQDGSTLAVNGTVWTFVTTTPVGNQIQIGATRTTTRNNIVATLAASADPGTAAATYAPDPDPAANSRLTITYKAAGPTGNAFTLARSTSPKDARCALSGPTLAGGVAPQPAIKPLEVVVDDFASLAERATPAGLLPGEWAYGDADGLGFATLYVRLPTGLEARSPAANPALALRSVA